MFTPVNRRAAEIGLLAPAPRTFLMDLLFARASKRTVSLDDNQNLHEKLVYEEY